MDTKIICKESRCSKYPGLWIIVLLSFFIINKGKAGTFSVKYADAASISQVDETSVLVFQHADTIPETSDEIFTEVDEEAQFKGGKDAWGRYMRKVLEKHLDQFSDQDFGTCIIRFVVDKQGTVSDVKATTMQGTKLAEVMIEAIRKGPKWLSAKKNGHPVASFRLQPVTLVNPSTN